VGDILMLHQKEQIPADLLLLSTHNSDGTCFVETKNLDGESNLKTKLSLDSTQGLSSAEDLSKFNFLYFHCFLTSLDLKRILFRSSFSFLKNKYKELSSKLNTIPLPQISTHFMGFLSLMTSK